MAGVAAPFRSALRAPLPPNVQLTTLQSLSEGKLLLRLSHQFAIDEDATLSKPVLFDLSTLFDPAAIVIKEAVELSLTANQNASAIRARRAAAAATWRAEGGAAPPPHAWRSAHFDWATNATVALGPLEIKTFELTI